MIKDIADNKDITIIKTKDVGTSKDVKLILDVVDIELEEKYISFLEECKYIFLEKNKDKIILFDPLRIIHENSIDILNNSNKKLNFLCIGKYLNLNDKDEEIYLILKNGKEEMGLYDNDKYINNKLANSFVDFFVN